MKITGIRYCSVVAILTLICLLAGFSGYRIHGRQPPRARLFVAIIPEISWPCFQKPVQKDKLTKPFKTDEKPHATGKILFDRQPDTFFRLSVKSDFVPESIWLEPVWQRLVSAGQQVIVAGWANAVPEEPPMVLRIPPYNKLKEFMTSNSPCSLDRRFPGWRSIAAGMKRELPDKILLCLVERARHIMPEAHVFLKLTYHSPMKSTLDNPETIQYCHFLNQSLIPLMDQPSEEGTTLMLISQCSGGGGVKRSSSVKGTFMAWGSYIRRPLHPLSATPDDIILTLLYLTDAPIDRHQKGTVLGRLLEDGLLFRRPIELSTFKTIRKQKRKIPTKNMGTYE